MLRRMRAVTAVVALSLGCGGAPGACRQPVSITDVQSGPTPLSIVLTVASCNGAPRAAVAEDDSEVRVTVTARVGGDNANACADGVKVVLQRPLGSRALIDGAVNRQLRAPVDSEGKYRSPRSGTGPIRAAGRGS